MGSKKRLNARLWGVGALLLALQAHAQLLITEVVTDPQQDWSSGGYVSAGTDSVSSLDEYIELYNAGTGAVDLTGYALHMDDTTPMVLAFPGAATFAFSSGSSLTSFLPGGFLVIGNPPGEINNSIEIRLHDPGGALLDSVTLGSGGPLTIPGQYAPSGNASGTLDEAVTRLWTGGAFQDTSVDFADFARTAASPLLPEAVAAIPEPQTYALLLAGLALLGFAARREPKPSRPRPARSSA